MTDPLLYDRLIRRFQTPTEREAEGKAKGYSGILEADLWRSEAKVEALANPDPDAALSYRRGPNGEVLAEEKDEIPANKEEGFQRWRWEMEMRFLRGADEDFDYSSVDGNEDFDDRAEEERQKEEQYFAAEEPEWMIDDSHIFDGSKMLLQGETGVQDF